MANLRVKQSFTSSIAVCVVLLSVTACFYVAFALAQEVGMRAAHVDNILKEHDK